jgi:hypothetical protein
MYSLIIFKISKKKLSFHEFFQNFSTFQLFKKKNPKISKNSKISKKFQKFQKTLARNSKFLPIYLCSDYKHEYNAMFIKHGNNS